MDDLEKAREKNAYEKYMLKEGYENINGKRILLKYPEKDPGSYKEALPSKG